MIAEFIHFYPAYTLEAVLAMYAVSFYALLSSMYKIKGSENYERAVQTAVGTAGGESLNEYLKTAHKQADGAEGLLRQARVLKEIKRNKK